MQQGIWVYDAFTTELFKGNPAGVVLGADNLTAAQMQALAAELRHSETAFVSGSMVQGWRVRFFTPTGEVDFCGHATVAYATAMCDEALVALEEGQNLLPVESNLGVLPLYLPCHQGQLESVWMRQARPQFATEQLSPELGGQICAALGLSPADLAPNIPLCKAYTGLWDLLVPVVDLPSFAKIRPDFPALSRLSELLEVVSLHPFVLLSHGEIRARARDFAPAVGIPEEAATGTANGALGAYLAHLGLVAQGQTIKIEQGVEMQRRSLIQVRVEEEAGELAVYVGGRARRFLRGEVELF